jgi:hypothetical protein
LRFIASTAAAADDDDDVVVWEGFVMAGYP